MPHHTFMLERRKRYDDKPRENCFTPDLLVNWE